MEFDETQVYRVIGKAIGDPSRSHKGQVVGVRMIRDINGDMVKCIDIRTDYPISYRMQKAVEFPGGGYHHKKAIINDVSLICNDDIGDICPKCKSNRIYYREGWNVCVCRGCGHGFRKFIFEEVLESGRCLHAKIGDEFNPHIEPGDCETVDRCFDCGIYF